MYKHQTIKYDNNLWQYI